MRCEVCAAPALPLHGACAFCRSPLSAGPDADGLLEYLAASLPAASARRGFLGRSPLREVTVDAAGVRYDATLRAGRLRLSPEAGPAEWVDRLLADLSREAQSNGSLRAAMTHAGWALR